MRVYIYPEFKGEDKAGNWPAEGSEAVMQGAEA